MREALGDLRLFWLKSKDNVLGGGSGAGVAETGKDALVPSPDRPHPPTPTHMISVWGGRGPPEGSEVRILQIQAVGATRCPVQFSTTLLLPLQGLAPSLLSHISGQQALPNRPG